MADRVTARQDASIWLKLWIAASFLVWFGAVMHRSAPWTDYAGWVGRVSFLIASAVGLATAFGLRERIRRTGQGDSVADRRGVLAAAACAGGFFVWQAMPSWHSLPAWLEAIRWCACAAAVIALAGMLWTTRAARVASGRHFRGNRGL